MNYNYRKRIAPIVLIVGILGCIILGIITDRELFYYGRAIIPHGKILGYADVRNMGLSSKLFPNCVELHADGLPIIAKGITLNGYGDIEVDTIISYGYNDVVIVAEFVSTEGEVYYFIDTPFTYHPTIMLTDTILEENPIKLFHLNKLVYGVNNTPSKILMIRNWSLILVFLLLIGLIGLIIPNKNNIDKGKESNVYN